MDTKKVEDRAKAATAKAKASAKEHGEQLKAREQAARASVKQSIDKLKTD